MILRSELERKAQLMQSREADLERRTWTFSAPSFVVTGGEYLLISVEDWKRTWATFEANRVARSTDTSSDAT